MSNYDFCINLLKKMYKKDFIISKQNKYEVFINNESYIIETKYEIKQVLRNILSSNNNNIDKDIVNLIELKYKMSKKELDLLNEIYPNIDVLISSYINNENPKIKIKEFNYDKLIEYFVKDTIEQLEDETLKEEYIYLNNELKIKEKELKKLKQELEKFQIAQKNSFYYETYRNYLFNEMNNYNEEKEMLFSNIELDKQKISKLQKQYQKINLINDMSKKTNIKRINKMNDLLYEIEYLENKIQEKQLELKQLENKNKENIKRNNKAFKEYIDMNIDEYSLIYERNKNADGKQILTDIQKIEKEIVELIDKINKSEYPFKYRKLKYFVEDNLKMFKKITDLNPKISKNIISLLESKNKFKI